MKVDCIFCGAKGEMRLIQTAYGFTGGDKWACAVCEGFVVTRPEQLPTKSSHED